jgi:hypothetical protein
MPTTKTLITDAGLVLLYLLVFVFTKFVKNIDKIVKYCLIIGGSLIGALFIVVFINANFEIGFFKTIPLLNKIFNTNHLASSYNLILKDIFSTNKILGTYPLDPTTSNSILFDNFMMAGLIGGLAFIFFICWGIYSLYRMCTTSDVLKTNKALIVTFTAALLGYALINYDMQPYLYYQNFIPIYISGPFLIVLFFFGYSFNIKFNEQKEPTATDEEEEVKEITI